jgi:hypothetical protein
MKNTEEAVERRVVANNLPLDTTLVDQNAT